MKKKELILKSVMKYKNIIKNYYERKTKKYFLDSSNWK